MGSDRGVESGFSIGGEGLILALEGAPIVFANANKPVAKGFSFWVCLIMAEYKLSCILARKLLRFRKVRQGLLCQSSISLRVMNRGVGKGIMFKRLHGAILSKEVKGKENKNQACTVCTKACGCAGKAQQAYSSKSHFSIMRLTLIRLGVSLIS